MKKIIGIALVFLCLPAYVQADQWVVLHTLAGHTKMVNSAVFSPDGRKIVTASWDDTAKIWDAATGKLLKTLTGHTGQVNSASFSPDGSRIVTASSNGTVKIWDAESGKLINTLGGYVRHFNSASFSPDGSRIVTASEDTTARIWDAATGKLLHTLVHRSSVNSAVFSPDGSKIVTASWDDTAKIWDAESGKLLKTLTGHEAWVNSAAFSPDGRKIVTASWDGIAKIWDAESGKLINTLSGHTDWVLSAAFSPDGRKIVTASKDHTAKIWIDVFAFFAALKNREKDIDEKRALIKQYVRDGVNFTSWRDSNGDNILHALVRYFDPQEDQGMIAYFISHYPDLLHVKNNTGETPIMLAVETSMFDIFERAASIKAKQAMQAIKTKRERPAASAASARKK